MPGNNILDQADALMRRHRSFVVRQAHTDSEIDDAAREEDSVPVLTDIIDTSTLAAQDIPALLATMNKEIEAELSAWLVDVLPMAVASASQHILTELDTRARATLLPRLQAILAARTPPGAAEPTGEAQDPSV